MKSLSTTTLYLSLLLPATASLADPLHLLDLDLTEQPDGRFASRANAECYDWKGAIDYSYLIVGRHRINSASGPELADRDIAARGEYLGFIHGRPAPRSCYRARIDVQIAGDLTTAKYLSSHELCKDPIEGPEPPHSTCPVLLDLDHDGYHLSGTNDPVRFDLDADGTQESVAWTSHGEQDAFLCHDQNGNGVIDDGRELFGQATLLANGAKAPNGFSALSELDLPSHGGDMDGSIGPEDQMFSRLCVWTDSNHDGISQPTELSDLRSTGVLRVGYHYQGSRRRDAHGNLFRYRSTARMLNPAGRERAVPIWDVFFAIPLP